MKLVLRPGQCKTPRPLTRNPSRRYGQRMKRACLLVASVLHFSGDAGIGKNTETVEEWVEAQNRVASRAGQEALRMHAVEWKHVQSAHFVLHSSDKGIATGTAQEAEFYFKSVRDDLKFAEPAAGRRSHIFLFEKEEDWKTFTKRAQLDPWTGGFFDGLDLFYRRKTGVGIRHSTSTLPHEIAHRVLYEKFPLGSIPLALNEGFAEFESRKLAFLYLRKRGYNVLVSSRQVSQDDFLPAYRLLGLTQYPSEEAKVSAFYDLSERFVNLLVQKHGFPRFLEFLQAMAGGQTFAAALMKVYSNEYHAVDQFERVFEEYAVLPKGN